MNEPELRTTADHHWPAPHAVVDESSLAGERRDLLQAAVAQILAVTGQQARTGPVQVTLYVRKDGVRVEIRDPRPLYDPVRPVPPAESITSTTFARWMADLLADRGMTQQDAARRIGVSLKTVNRWVRGHTEPRLRELYRVLEAFGEAPPAFQV